jgi:hypothetical protein
MPAFHLILAATVEDATTIHAAIGDGSELHSFEELISEIGAPSLIQCHRIFAGHMRRAQVIAGFLRNRCASEDTPARTLYILDPRFGEGRLGRQALHTLFQDGGIGYPSSTPFFPTDVWLMDRDRQVYTARSVGPLEMTEEF